MRLADERSQLVDAGDSAGYSMVAGIFHFECSICARRASIRL
jgi:hypothetical protein